MRDRTNRSNGYYLTKPNNWRMLKEERKSERKMRKSEPGPKRCGSARLDLARLGLVLDPAWPTTPSPRPRRSPVHPLLPLPPLAISNSSSFSLSLARWNAERERLVNEAHAHARAHALHSPCLPIGLPPSTFPSAAVASTIATATAASAVSSAAATATTTASATATAAVAAAVASAKREIEDTRSRPSERKEANAERLDASKSPRRTRRKIGERGEARETEREKEREKSRARCSPTRQNHRDEKDRGYSSVFGLKREQEKETAGPPLGEKRTRQRLVKIAATERERERASGDASRPTRKTRPPGASWKISAWEESRVRLLM